MNILQVKNLTKKFGNFTAVDNISFDLKEGEILGLLGPNGAGKTTTIDMLLGLTKPTAGEIKIFNLPFEENRERILKEMNFSAAYVNLPWRLKVVENLYTFARLYEVSNYKIKVDKLLDEFRISDFKNKLTSDLSSGQLARLYLCKAFINQPKLLLLDEPTAFLDPDIADFTRKFIVKRVKSEGGSVLFTSHNMAEVTEMCDRVIFLHHGKIIAEDTPYGLAQKIKSCRVRLIFTVSKEKVITFLSNYHYQFWEEDKELVIDEKEEKVGQLLGRLSLAKLKYSQITIEKPTLEDFFLKVAREKYE
jgi:ABC-2 type transport system ATP-binding protein